MFTQSPVRMAFAVAVTALLVACGDRSTTSPVENELEVPTEELAPVELIPAGNSYSVENEIIIGGGEEDDDDGETLPVGGGDSPFSPEALPIVMLDAPSHAEAGSQFTFELDALSFASELPTYKVVVIPGYVGPGTYSVYVWRGTISNITTKTFTAPASAALLGTTRIKVSLTNVNGTTTDITDLPILPRRPRFTGEDVLPATAVAGVPSVVTLNLTKPAQPTATDYVLPLTVDLGDGRTDSHDWNIVEALSGAFKTIAVVWNKPGTYSATFKVAATTAPAYASTRTESITILPNPKWPYITEFESPAEVVAGRTYQISFNPGGPEYPGGLFQVRTYRENGSYSTTSVQPGGAASIVYDWPNAPGEAWQTTIVSGTVDGVLRADTIRWSAIVVPEPIVIGSFVGPAEDVNFGQEASFSFRATGGPGPYTATITYGDGSEATVRQIARGATVTQAHTWAESGLWDVTIVVDNGFTSTTLNEEVAIYRPRPTVDDVAIPEKLYFEQESEIYFVPNDASDVEAMAYEILISDDTQTDIIDDLATQGVPVQHPITAPDFNGVYKIRIVVHSGMNGLVLTSDTAFHTLTVEDLVCTAGSYRVGFECVAAPAGFHVPADGATEAVPCAIGTYQDQEGQASCIGAPAGSFVSGTAATQPELCPAGSWQDQPGSAACNAAQPGHFVNQFGATQSTPCAPGTFQPAAGSASCVAAAPGSFVSSSGATQAELCAPGTFQPAAGGTSCDAAAPGSFVSGSGAAQAELCAPGTFQPASGQTDCIEAPMGSYVDVMGAAAATPCPITRSTLGTGSTSADQCISLGAIATVEIDQAVGDGTLVPAANGNGGQQQFDGWVSDLSRSFDFLEGPQRQAGCSGVRNALARADGDPSPRDVVTGPARAGVEAALRRILDEYGCQI